MDKKIQEEFDEVIHNSEVLNTLDKPKEFLEGSTEDAIKVGSEEYYRELENNK